MRGTSQGDCRQRTDHVRIVRLAAQARGSRGEPGVGATSAAVQQALSFALQRAAAAYATPSTWEQRVRAALSSLLDLFEQQPDLARLCIAPSESAGPAALALREETLALLARRIDDGRRHARRQPPKHAAQAVLAGAIGAIRGRLLEPGGANVTDLLDPLMSFIVLAYRGAAASRGELAGAALSRPDR